MPFIYSDNTILPFQLRRSLRAKHLQIVLRASGFEIVAPWKIPNKEILHFLMRQQKWMLKVLARKKPCSEHTSVFAWPDVFLSGSFLPFRASPLKLQLKYHFMSAIERQGNRLIVTLPWQEIRCAQVNETVKKMVYAWYQKEAQKAVKYCIEHFCPLLGKWPKGFGMKQQKTRWGSCSPEDHIYLNWLLILAPYGVLEYVIVHELAHMFYRNHGKRFWAKVASCFPDYKKYALWLRQNGIHLQPMVNEIATCDD